MPVRDKNQRARTITDNQRGASAPDGIRWMSAYSAIWLAIHATGGSVKAVLSRPPHALTKGVISGMGGCNGYSL